MADEFVENVISNACTLAKHRKSDRVEVKDVQLHLSKNWNMEVPGYSSVKPLKKYPQVDAHRQRLAAVKRTKKSSAQNQEQDQDSEK